MRLRWPRCPARDPCRAVLVHPHLVDPLTEADLINVTVSARAVGRVKAEAVGRFDLTPRDWEMVEMGILAGANEMLALLTEQR